MMGFNISDKVRLLPACIVFETFIREIDKLCASFRHALLKYFRFRAPRIISWFL